MNEIDSANDWESVDVSANDKVFSPRPRQIICSGAGDLACLTVTGTARTIAVLAGLPYNIRPQTILSTGTTATGIVAFY